MEVILTEDVKSLGKKDEIVKVSDGYAKNFLFPKKKAVEASAKNLNDLKLRKAGEDRMAKKRLEEAKATAEEIGNKTIIVKLKSGKDGKVFGSISSKEIAQEAMSQFGIELDRKKIQIDEPIKSIGSYVIPIKLHPQVSAEIKLKVEEA